MNLTKQASVLSLVGASLTLAAQSFEPIQAHSDFGSSNFGNYVSADQNKVAIGESFQGAVYVFAKSGGRWIREQRIPAPFQIGAIDLQGNRLVISDAFVSVGANIQVGRVLVYEFSPASGWTLTSEILAPEQVNQPRFGLSLDLQGDRLLIGAPRAPSTDVSGQPTLPDGRAYVYERNGNSWNLTATLASNDNGQGQRFGLRVAFAGSDQMLVSSRFTGPAVAGARGYLYAFNLLGGVWSQTQRIYGGALNARFAEQFSVEGDLAAAIAGSNLYVLRRSSGLWTVDPTPIASSHAVFSTDVAVDQNGIAWSETNGAVRYATRTGQTLGVPMLLPTPSQLAPSVELNASEIVFSDLRYTDASQTQGIVYAANRNAPFDVSKRFRSGNGNFGPANGAVVSISGDDLLVTAPSDDAQGNQDQGSAKLFKRVAGAWQLQSELTTPTAQAKARLGDSGVVQGDLLALGAPGAGSGAGLAFVYARSQNSWSVVCTLSPLVANSTRGFGQTLSFDGGLLVIRDQSDATAGTTLRTWSVSSSGCIERDALTRTLAIGGGDDSRFGQSIAVENGVLAAIGTGATSNQLATVLTYTRGASWSAATVLSLPSQPVGTNAGLNLREIRLDPARLVVSDILSAGGITFIPSFHSFPRTGSSFSAGRTDTLPSSAGIGGYNIFGESTLWFSGRVGDGDELSYSPAGISASELLNTNDRQISSALSANRLVSGQSIKRFPSNREFGQVEVFERIGGVWSPGQMLPILPERIFAEGLEDVP